LGVSPDFLKIERVGLALFVSDALHFPADREEKEKEGEIQAKKRFLFITVG
jgi:hypothetical protein